MVKPGYKFIKFGIEYTVNSVEPKKILEIVSKSNPLYVNFSTNSDTKYSSGYRTVVQVRTQEEWNNISEIYGINWSDNARNSYNIYGIDSCINTDTHQYSSYLFYFNDEYKIIQYSDFISNCSISTTLNKFNIMMKRI